MKIKAIINQLTSFITYLIHCEIIDKYENLFNGSPSSIIAVFDIVVKPFEGVTYQSGSETLMRKINSSNQIASMRIKVTDENNDLIDFNGLPLRFEIEIV